MCKQPSSPLQTEGRNPGQYMKQLLTSSYQINILDVLGKEGKQTHTKKNKNPMNA